MKSFTITQRESGLTAIKYCKKVCHNIPDSLLHKYFRKKRIKINGKRRQENTVLNSGDLIRLYINDELFGEKPVKKADKQAKLDIVYEDDNIIIVYKPRGLLCHSDNKNQANLIDSIITYLTDKSEYSADNVNAFTPSLCNRIDQGTEGLVIAAKNYIALAEMNNVIKSRILEKKYLCVTQGKIKDGIYSAFLTRDKLSKKVTVSPAPSVDSKEIITGFETIDVKGGYSLVECSLITGRTHQIRAHMAFLGSPISGDRKYGKAENGLKSQLLCAYKLSFGQIPPEYTVSYLSGKEFNLKDNSVKKFFDNLK